MKDNKRDSFCLGFVYGERHGCEGILHGKMTPEEINANWILARLLFNELSELELVEQPKEEGQ